jgi:elongation factor Ts
MSFSMEQVKELREKTNAGVMDCKKALEQSKGDLEKAIDLLRQWGVAAAQKKASREALDGVIYSYIHPGNRIGVLVEVNCETDFVARNQDFQNFVKEITMQIAAANPRYIAVEDVPQEVLEKERQIYRAQFADGKKDEKTIERIVEGKLSKFFSDVCLMEQAYIRDESIKIKDLVQKNIAKFGENIKIRRFIRYQLGEEI